jgi:hypothetical protein
VGRLNAENSLIPTGIMTEADVFNLEVRLPSFPLRHPGQMDLLEMLAQLVKFGLTKPRNFDLIGTRKNNPEHGDPASWSDQRDGSNLQLAMAAGFGKVATDLLTHRWESLLPLEPRQGRR